MEKSKAERREEIEARKNASVEDKLSLAKLNGVDLDKLNREQAKHLMRRKRMNRALGIASGRAIDVGGILKKAKVQRWSGGVKFL